MKLNYIELHRGNNETFRIDFNSRIDDNYNEKLDIPAVGLIKEGMNKFNGLKICVGDSNNKVVKHLRRFYKCKHDPMRYFEDYRISRQKYWEGIDNFKYMLISENHSFLSDNIDFKVGSFVLCSKTLKIKELLKICNDTVICVCINLEGISDEDKRLNCIVCEDGTCINIDKLCREFSLLLDFSETSIGKSYAVENSCIDDVMFIINKGRLFILDVSNNINLSNMVYMEDMYTKKILKKEVLKDLYYLRLSMLSGDCIVDI